MNDRNPGRGGNRLQFGDGRLGDETFQNEVASMHLEQGADLSIAA